MAVERPSNRSYSRRMTGLLSGYTHRNRGPMSCECKYSGTGIQSINQSINQFYFRHQGPYREKTGRESTRQTRISAGSVAYYTFRISYESLCIFPGYVSVLVSDVCRIINITHRNIHYTCTCSRKILLATSLLQVDLSEYNVIKYLLILHTLSPGGSSL